MTSDKSSNMRVSLINGSNADANGLRPVRSPTNAIDRQPQDVWRIRKLFPRVLFPRKLPQKPHLPVYRARHATAIQTSVCRYRMHLTVCRSRQTPAPHRHCHAVSLTIRYAETNSDNGIFLSSSMAFISSIPRWVRSCSAVIVCSSDTKVQYKSTVISKSVSDFTILITRSTIGNELRSSSVTCSNLAFVAPLSVLRPVKNTQELVTPRHHPLIRDSAHACRY